MRKYLFTLIISWLAITTFANDHLQHSSIPNDDSIRISLLTCGSGEEIYSLFGHTAIRYEYPSRGIDVVFNYGMFSFNTPNFIWRFSLGETDYLLGVYPYKYFESEYIFANREVWQQELNLSDTEKKRLWNLLNENYLPKNRKYRYNFLYDNCATRPRDRIEEALNFPLNYVQDMSDTNTGKSFRDLIHQYTQEHPWAQFGIDFCLGSQADKPINRRQMMFAPFYLMDFFATAQITNKDHLSIPLVKETKKLINSNENIGQEKEQYPTPSQLFWLLFIIVFAITCYEIKRRKSLWGIDIILFATAGIAGCIIAFLALFSQHPAVSPNYLLFVFHPFHLICLPWMIYAIIKSRRSLYLTINLIILTLFIVLWYILPQKFNTAVLPLALCLLIRSISNFAISILRK